jgi:hypothetical protein
MNSGGVRISALSKELRLRWQETRETWVDSRSREFDAKYMQELFAQCDRTVEVIGQLDKLVARIRKDCE